MDTYVNKEQEHKHQALTSNEVQKQDTKKSSFYLVDNRPGTIAQRKLQAEINRDVWAKKVNISTSDYHKPMQLPIPSTPNSQQVRQLKAVPPFVNSQAHVIQLISYSEAVIGKAYRMISTGQIVTLESMSHSWLRFRGLAGSYRASDVEELAQDAAENDSEEDMASNYSSDIGESSQEVADDAAEQASLAARGAAGREERIKQMQRLNHKRGGAALSNAVKVAVGAKTAGQSTFVQGTDQEGGHHYAATSSSAPFEAWAGQRPFVVRNEFGNGSHVHGEAGLIYHVTENEIKLKHVAVHKPICPVCAAVLKAYGISYNISNVRDEYPATWGNPFNQQEDPENWAKVNQAATTAITAANASTRLLD